MSEKPLYIRNKKRALRDALGRNEQWVPEHERLNMSPIVPIDASEDFMNEKRRKGAPRPIGSRKPPVPVARTKAVSPTGEEQAWLPTGSRPYQAPERNYSHGDVSYDDVPEPPQNKFEHPYRPLGVDLSGVLSGQYCLIYDSEVWASDSKEEIEAAIEQIMRADPNVDEDDLIIMHRLSIKKIGVIVG